MLPGFFFCSLLPLQQTTSGIGHRVKSSFLGLATNTLNVRNITTSAANNGVLYFLDYVEDIYIMVFSVLVSILNPNHMHLPLLLTVYQYCTLTNYVQQ